MSVHPDKTARRAVDACGGAFPVARNDYDSGYERGHEAALDAAMEAVKPADALTAELLDALVDMQAVLGEIPMPDCPALTRGLAATAKARAVIAKATGAA